MVQNITNISTYVGIRDFKREKRVRELLGGMAGNKPALLLPTFNKKRGGSGQQKGG